MTCAVDQRFPKLTGRKLILWQAFSCGRYSRYRQLIVNECAKNCTTILCSHLKFTKREGARMLVTSLERASIGERWKDREGIVWEVSSVNTKNKPRLIFFERVVKDSKAAPVDRAAFHIERGWEKVSGAKVFNG